MAVIGSGEHHAAAGAEAVHILSFSSQRGDRIAIGHRLGEGAQVRRHAADRLVTTQAVPEARDHFVEDQHHPMHTGQVAQRGEELRAWQDAANVMRDDLDDDRCDLIGTLRHCLGDRFDVIEWQDQGLLDNLGQHTQRERVVLADLLGRTDHIHQHRVVPAVVGALEFDDFGATGYGAREP